MGDITYLPLLGGRWCYLATWRDTCSRRVVGWHLTAQMPTELVLLALAQALTLRQPAPARAAAPRPRRPRQPIHQRRLPRPHRPTALPLLRSKKPAWK